MNFYTTHTKLLIKTCEVEKSGMVDSYGEMLGLLVKQRELEIKSNKTHYLHFHGCNYGYIR